MIEELRRDLFRIMVPLPDSPQVSQLLCGSIGQPEFGKRQCDSWEAFPLAQKWFATGEAIAHLRYLNAKGRIGRIREREHYRYHVIG